MTFNKFPWTDFHGFNLEWVIKTVQECLETVKKFGEEIASFPEIYETKEDVTSSRKLSTTGDFTGSWNGNSFVTVFGKVDNNTDMVNYLTNQFTDGQTGLVIDGGFFAETGIKKNYNGGAF